MVGKDDSDVMGGSDPPPEPDPEGLNEDDPANPGALDPDQFQPEE